MTARRISTRATCLTLDIEGWSRRQVPEQLRARRVLAEVLDEACARAGLDHGSWQEQSTGDGVVAVLPSDLDEARALPDLIREMGIALRQANRVLNEQNRVRLRMAMATGLIFGDSAGFAGRAVIEACRLLDSAPVRQALRDYSHTDLAVIVTDALYQDVIADGGFRDLGPRDFWPALVSIPDKGFAADAWVHVTDRRGGPERAVAAPPPAAVAELPAADECRALSLRAERRIALGDHAGAIAALEELTRLWPDLAEPPVAATLLRLGQCHLELGERKAAMQVWLYLLDRVPDAAEAHLRIGRLAAREGRPDLARAYLTEGLRVTRDRAVASSGPGTGDFLAALSELAARPDPDS